MAKISLRSYRNEIDKLIERGQFDEAIGHSKYILKQFPKYIDIYRLLGKAYLETQKYSEAADILQRVLSVIPDDFISQIGMSIITEDEGNLDAALFHMERAFEIQPSNIAVQDELRRLYGRRDGIEPPKVRLTQGALVRMYLRGELYPQAIAEARAALAENSQRIDLEVILARLYYLSNQKVESIEVCSRLVSRLPYCYEANRILAEVLPSTSRAEDAKTYLQRVIALDPYAAHTSPSSLSTDQVPENAISLEKLEWAPSLESAEQPEWAQSIGVELQASQQADSDWLADFSIEEVTPTDVHEVLSPQDAESIKEELAHLDLSAASEDSSEEHLPDWMKESGWVLAANGDQDADAPTGIEEQEISPTDIPEWLKTLGETEKPDTSTYREEPQSTPAVSFRQEDNELPEWLKDLEASHKEEIPPRLDRDQGDLPEWLKAIEEEAQPKATSDEVEGYLKIVSGQPETNDREELPLPEMTLPDETSPEDSQQEPLQSSPASGELLIPIDSLDANAEMPAWLAALKEDGSDQPPVEEPSLEVEMSKPSDFDVDSGIDEAQPFIPPRHTGEDQLEGESPVIVAGDKAPGEEKADTSDAAFAWLESLAGRQGADEETFLLKPEDRVEEPPDWVNQEPEVSSDEIPQSLENQETAERPFIETPPTWQEMSEKPEPKPDFEPPASLGRDRSLHEWLKSLDSQPSAEQEDEEQEDRLPSWLRSEKLFEKQPPKPLSSDEETLEESASPSSETIHGETFFPASLQASETEDAFERSATQPFVEDSSMPEILTGEEEYLEPIDETAEQADIYGRLNHAQSAVIRGDLETAMSQYAEIIGTGNLSEEVIHDLLEASARHPDEYSIWQILGDAYVRLNRLQEALDAYAKAEALLHR